MAFVLKVVCGGDMTVRMPFDSTPSFSDVEAAVKKNIPSCVTFFMKYVDDEGDLCSLVEPTFEDFLTSARETQGGATLYKVLVYPAHPIVEKSVVASVTPLPKQRKFAQRQQPLAPSSTWMKDTRDLEDLLQQFVEEPITTKKSRKKKSRAAAQRREQSKSTKLPEADIKERNEEHHASQNDQCQTEVEQFDDSHRSTYDVDPGKLVPTPSGPHQFNPQIPVRDMGQQLSSRVDKPIDSTENSQIDTWTRFATAGHTSETRELRTNTRTDNNKFEYATVSCVQGQAVTEHITGQCEKLLQSSAIEKLEIESEEENMRVSKVSQAMHDFVNIPFDAYQGSEDTDDALVKTDVECADMGCENEVTKIECADQGHETEDELFWTGDGQEMHYDPDESPALDVEPLRRSSSCPCQPTWVAEESSGGNFAIQQQPKSLISQAWPFVQTSEISPDVARMRDPMQNDFDIDVSKICGEAAQTDLPTLASCGYHSIVWMPVLLPWPTNQLIMPSMDMSLPMAACH